MLNFIIGLIIFAILPLIIALFLVKWFLDYRRTGRVLVLYDKKVKRWKFLVSVLSLIFCIFIILGVIFLFKIENNTPIQILPEEYDLWDWNGAG